MNREKVLSPFIRFFRLESFSGILLLAATVVALAWANSPWSESYEQLWNIKIGFSAGDFILKKPLLLWINDGLMAIFFFLIGLEVKREFMIGEFNTPRKVAFPLVGALGGMSVPVLFFIIFNRVPEAAHGWGIPMATDIAFSLAILKILGKRVPYGLLMFLTAFAIIDDIGAVLIIAIFYSSELHLLYLFVALGLLLVIYFLTLRGKFSSALTLVSGGIIWYLFLKSGFHPTIAGILMAFAVPVRQKIDTPMFLNRLEEITTGIKKAKITEKPVLCKEQIDLVDDLEEWTEKYQSPLQALEHKLHAWVAYLIIPLFALANAGVQFAGNTDMNFTLILTLVLSLIVGNSIGVSLMVLLSKKLKIITLPEKVETYHIIGVAFLAGVGFTMAIFISNLAFPGNEILLGSAKVGILIGSFLSGLLGYLVLRFGKSATTAGSD